MGAHGQASDARRKVDTRGRLIRRRSGFTLIELLVVIGIIAVLAAIVIPVYARAQEKARQTTCLANLHTIAMALKIYQMDNGAYPPPYDPVSGYGGVSSLTIAEYGVGVKNLRCPDDQGNLEEYMVLHKDLKITVQEPGGPVEYTGPSILEPGDPNYGQKWNVAADRNHYYRYHYSSYNCMPFTNPMPDANGIATVRYQLYNYYGYGIDGLSHLTAADANEANRRYLPSSTKFAGLMNRWAPDETMVTHCPYHRDFFGRQPAWQDPISFIGGNTEIMHIVNYDWVNQPPQ